MSGKVGTLRYMAPEVARHEPYNVSADTYSFAMVSYELLSLEKPFDGWTRDMHSDLVCHRGVRPDTVNTMHPIPDEMKAVLEQAWSNNPTCRGTMSQIGVQVQILEAQQVKYLAEQQLHVELQQHLQLQPPQQPVPLALPPQAAMNPIAHQFCTDLSPSPPYRMVSRKASLQRGHCVHHLDDSMGTIDTGSLSAESDDYF